MVDRCILKEGDWEADSWKMFSEEILKNGAEDRIVFIDIGSYFGLYAIKAHQIGFKEIHAFEADHDNFIQLSANILLNSLFDEINCHNVFLSNTNEKLAIVNSTNIPDNRGMAGSITENSDDAIKMEGTPLDEVLRIKGKFIAIKIDVEGNEGRVLEGGIDLLSNNKVLLLIENLKFLNINHGLLKKLGFTLITISSKDQNEIWKNY